MQGELVKSARRRHVRAACALALLLSACGDSQSPAPIESPASIESPVSLEPSNDAERRAAGWQEMNGLLVPPDPSPDPTLPDSCGFLTEADPRGMIQKPMGAIMRISDVCIAYDAETPTLEHSLQVELRYPASFELEQGLPRNQEQYWGAEGTGVDLMGGRRETIEDLSGVGDYAVWYPIDDGFTLHAYWQGRYILRLTMRGIEKDAALNWARKVAQRAIDATATLAGPASANPAATSR
jgi:hypothetical protein